MKWFTNINTIADLRNRYKQLLCQYHPDNNPNKDTTAIMQEINVEYDKLMEQLKATDNTYKETEGFSETELKKILNEIIGLNADIMIEIVGTWIWIKGDTYPIKDRLKELNFKWSKQKQMWYWGVITHRVHTSMSMEAIRMKYGSTIYNNRREERQAIDAP